MPPINDINARVNTGRGGVRIIGAAALNQSLRDVHKKLPKEMRAAFNEAARHVVGRARTKVPVHSGRLFSSIKPASTQRTGRVAMTPASRVPYAGWIEFGGRIEGPKGIRTRPFIRQGRYLFPSAEEEAEPVRRTLEEQLGVLIRRAGLG